MATRSSRIDYSRLNWPGALKARQPHRTVFTQALRVRIFCHIPLNDLSGVTYDKSVEQGAAIPCYVATSSALAGVSGEYFVDCNPAQPSQYQTDKAMAARLWDVSTDLTRGCLS
jgi:hypothetical protein